MFDRNFNIILGDRYSGRTHFLWELSNSLMGDGYKTCFIGGTTELSESNQLIKSFSFSRFIKSLESDNISSMQLVKEISERDKYDYILVDDINMISKKCISILKSIDIPKIVTCSSDTIPVLNELFNSYYLNVVYDESLSLKGTNILIDGVYYNTHNIIKSFMRSKKITKILQ